MPTPQQLQPPPVLSEDYLLAEDVASALKIHVTSVYRLIKSGRLKAIRVGGGSRNPRGLRIPRSSFEKLQLTSVVTDLGEVA